jgi:hypothetical protein
MLAVFKPKCRKSRPRFIPLKGMKPISERFQFSGHESFHCRQFWLKKGFDFVDAGKKFSNESSVIDLGVGKNMVTAIRYWLRAFGLLNEADKPNELARLILSTKGWDPYLENEGTLWLLHFHLTKGNTASIFNIIFNELRKSKPEFEEKHFYSIVSDFGKFSEATLSKDYTVFRNTYAISSSNKSEIEDSYSGILTELGLVTSKKSSSKSDILVIESRRRPEIPAPIILYSILIDRDGDSINFDKLFSEKNSVGSIFALNREGLIEKLEEIASLYPKQIVFKNEAGVREIQFKGKLDPIKRVLADYYGS